MGRSSTHGPEGMAPGTVLKTTTRFPPMPFLLLGLMGHGLFSALKSCLSPLPQGCSSKTLFGAYPNIK